MAKWQPCFLMLSGFHLYVLEYAKSQSYQRCLRYFFISKVEVYTVARETFNLMYFANIVQHGRSANS